MIDLGQRRLTPEIMNVSVMAGSPCDTAKNGLTVVVTARHDRRRRNLAARSPNSAGLTGPALSAADSLDEAVEKALEVGRDPSLPALAFAMLPHNPAAAVAAIHLPAAAHFTRPECPARCSASSTTRSCTEAHRHGVGASFEAQFNRSETTRFSEPYIALPLLSR